MGLVIRGVSSPEKRGGRTKVWGEVNVMPESRERERRRGEAPIGGFGGMHPKKILTFWHPNGVF